MLNVEKWIAGGRYQNKPRVSTFRRITGCMLTFGVSGIIHALMLMSLDASLPFPYRHALFFVINVVIVCLEVLMKKFLRERRIEWRIPVLISWILRLIYVHVLLTWLSHYLFWPDAHKCNDVDEFMDQLISLLPKSFNP